MQNICAFVNYNEHRYCATSQQVDQADLYIIDPEGVEFFKKNYNGYKTVYVIGIKVPGFIAKHRMKKRGDSRQEIKKRMEKDKVHFASLPSVSDIVVYNFFIHSAKKKIKRFITSKEKEWGEKKGVID